MRRICLKPPTHPPTKPPTRRCILPLPSPRTNSILCSPNTHYARTPLVPRTRLTQHARAPIFLRARAAHHARALTAALTFSAHDAVATESVHVACIGEVGCIHE